MFQQLNGQDRITIILVTHDANVARYAGRVIHIHDGAILDRRSEARPKAGAAQVDIVPVAAAMGGAR